MCSSDLHVDVSTAKGHTWKDRVSFSHLCVDRGRGGGHGNKIGPNKLMVIGGVGGSGGVQVFPVTVERMKVSPDEVALSGRVLDEGGKPIAGVRVERSPNRYTAEDWLEHATETEPWYHTDPLTVGSPKLSYLSIREAKG